MLARMLTAVVPVFAIAGIGAILRRASHTELRSLHLLVYYVAGPAAVFSTLLHADLTSSSLWRIAGFAFAMYGLLMLGAIAWGSLSGWDTEKRRAAVLTLASTNCANYGLPIVAFAFGEEGLVVGMVFVVMHIIVHIALGGTYSGWSRRPGATSPLLRVLGIPYLYAAALALGLRGVVHALPVPLEEALSLLGRTWIPLLILLLGAEVASLRSVRQIREALPWSVAKLALPPFLALGLTLAFGITGTERLILIVQASMPTAVNGMLFARQFGTRPDLVATALMLTTLGSVATLPLLLSLLP